jgi:hypothetical protein
MTAKERLDTINATLQAMQSFWPVFVDSIDARIAELTLQLINNDNEQTRGRIKALLEVKNMPDALQSEREGISAALSVQDAAS